MMKEWEQVVYMRGNLTCMKRNVAYDQIEALFLPVRLIKMEKVDVHSVDETAHGWLEANYYKICGRQFGSVSPDYQYIYPLTQQFYLYDLTHKYICTPAKPSMYKVIYVSIAYNSEWKPLRGTSLVAGSITRATCIQYNAAVKTGRGGSVCEYGETFR